MSSKYTEGELILFLDGPRLIDGSDLNHNFELLFYPASSTRAIIPAMSPYTIQATDRTLLCDTTLGDVTINLIDARDYLQPQLNIKKNDQSANKVIVVPILGDTVDLQSTHANPYLIIFALQSISLVSDFVSNWPII